MTWLVENKENIAIIISLASFIISVFALLLNFQRTRIAVREDKDKQNQKKKANLKLDRTKEPGSKRLNDVLIITNDGKGKATNISLTFVNRDGQINPLFGELPTVLQGESSVKIGMTIHGGTAPPWDITVSWDDDFELGNNYTTKMN
ncbi:hypothetical protein [Candidatus Pristimantibacillus sp. PTI5]|uniref:hypothetical protein n=1 Tax=Candidatus Pristimantibacillus sp. PTI5 TaxID=3400422 RepID=UPI003B01B487